MSYSTTSLTDSCQDMLYSEVRGLCEEGASLSICELNWRIGEFQVNPNGSNYDALVDALSSSFAVGLGACLSSHSKRE